jgi:8-oxo-dGTP pyrophosphatase MutT (NUDIX family)
MQMHTSGLVVIRDRKLLLAFSKNKRAFYLPGGKTDEGETPVQSLIREIKEELDIDLLPERLSWYTHITAPAYGELNGTIMEQECYRYELEEEPRPSAEIGPVRFFDCDSYAHEPEQVPGVVQILAQLKKEGLVS